MLLNKGSGLSFLRDAGGFPLSILGRDVLGVLWLLKRVSITLFCRASPPGSCPSRCSCDGCWTSRWHFTGPPSVGDSEWRHQQVKLRVPMELSILALCPAPLWSQGLRSPAPLSSFREVSVKEHPFLLSSQGVKLPAGLNCEYFLSFPESFSFSESCLAHSSPRRSGRREGSDVELWGWAVMLSLPCCRVEIGFVQMKFWRE